MGRERMLYMLWRARWLVLGVAIAGFLIWLTLPASNQLLFYVTGEEARLAQLRALWNLALEQTRPPFSSRPMRPSSIFLLTRWA